MNKNSLAAYRSIGAHLDGHYLAIYESLLSKGAQTAWQISRTSYWDATFWDDKNKNLETAQVFRRLNEMVKAGLIELLDWTEPSPSGRQCSVYWVSTKGKK